MGIVEADITNSARPSVLATEALTLIGELSYKGI